MKRINSILKRIFDVLFSFIGIIVLSPLLIIVAISIKISSEGPVLFKQERVGMNKRHFKILKFRTMVVNAESIGRQITVGEDKRITKVGYFLRKYKIDELPQLFNVLKGDMSLVGPRPEVPRYVELYNDEQNQVFSVKPGITDMASIRYCDESELLGKADNAEDYYVNCIMKDKLQLNIEYIKKSNVILDIYIILKTVVKCIRK